MKTQQGFVGSGILIAIVAGLIVVGGGAYYVMQKSSSSPALSEHTLDTLPAIAPQSLANPAPMQKGQHVNSATLPNEWKSVVSAAVPGLVVEYPSYMKITSNESVPIAHLEFEGTGNNDVLIFVSAASLIPSNQDLKSWLESFDYFKDQHRSQKYESYTRKDGVEVFASFGNTQSYDDAFIRLGTAVVYIKNGINKNTKASESDFREIIERVKLPGNIKIGVGDGGASCFVGHDNLMVLYWGTQYRKANPSVPFIYTSGSYCELVDGSKLMTMGYSQQGEVNDQAIVSFDASGKISNTYKAKICHTIGDFDAPRILSVEQGSLNLFCLSGDAGETAFSAYQAPLATLVPIEATRDSAIYNTIKTAVEKLYGIDF